MLGKRKSEVRKMKYDIGTRIHNRWVIVAVLLRHKQNRKLLCLDTHTGTFKEAWIWDLTRGITTSRPNKKSDCQITKCNYSKQNKEELLNLNAESAYKLYLHSPNITQTDWVILRDIREGSYSDVDFLLHRFADLLECSGHARRNINLCHVIGTTYMLLILRGKI